MAIIDTFRRRDAVYYPQDGMSADGNPTFGIPVEIKVRWDDVTQRFNLPDGSEAISNAVVYVDRQMDIGDLLFYGTLLDLKYPDEPLKNRRINEIRQFSRIDNLKATKTLFFATV